MLKAEVSFHGKKSEAVLLIWCVCIKAWFLQQNWTPDTLKLVKRGKKISWWAGVRISSRLDPHHSELTFLLGINVNCCFPHTRFRRQPSALASKRAPPPREESLPQGPSLLIHLRQSFIREGSALQGMFVWQRNRFMGWVGWTGLTATIVVWF